jgi:hypothetical protein
MLKHTKGTSKEKPNLTNPELRQLDDLELQEIDTRPSRRWLSNIISDKTSFLAVRQSLRSPPMDSSSTRGGGKLDPLATLAREMKRMFKAMPPIPTLPPLNKSLHAGMILQPNEGHMVDTAAKEQYKAQSLLNDTTSSKALQRLNMSSMDHAKHNDLNTSTNSIRSQQSRVHSVPKKPQNPYAPKNSSVSVRRRRNIRSKDLDSAAKAFNDFYAKSKVLLSELEQRVLGVS